MKKLIIRNANYNCDKHSHLACSAALANIMVKSHLRRKGCVSSYRVESVIKGVRAGMQQKHGAEVMEELGLLPASHPLPLGTAQAHLPKGNRGMGPSVTGNTQDAGPSSGQSDGGNISAEAPSPKPVKLKISRHRSYHPHC